MARDVEKEFAKAKKYTAIKKRTKPSIPNNKLNDYLQEHFAAKTPALVLPPELVQPEPWPTINIRPHIMHFRRLVFSYTE